MMSTGPIGSSRVPRCNSEACASRQLELENQVKSLSREVHLKDDQLFNMISRAASNTSPTDRRQGMVFMAATAAAAKQQQQHHVSADQQSHRIADLMLQLGDLQAENARLKSALKAEDKVKQELMAAYHNSLKEITELTCEFQLVNNFPLALMTPFDT